MLEWTICYWRHRQWLWSPGSLDRFSLSLISFMRHEDHSFWNVNACILVDRSVLKESYTSTFSTKVCILKTAAPPSSKGQTRHYNQEDCRLRIHRLKKHLICLPASQEHYICRNWMFYCIRVSAIRFLLSWHRGFVLRISSCWGMKLTTLIPSNAEVKNEWQYSSDFEHTFLPSRRAKGQQNVYLQKEWTVITLN